jgi:hypothetical protein
MFGIRAVSGIDLLTQVEQEIARRDDTPRAQRLIDEILVAWCNAGLFDEARHVALELKMVDVGRFVTDQGRDLSPEEDALIRTNLGLKEAP